MPRLVAGLLLTLCSWIAAAHAAGPDSGDFTRGNALYADGKFAEAADAYEMQVQRGEYRANLFYNLGDAYYRRGERGRAILNYQRALLLDPAHAEAAANLAFVRGRVPSAAAGSGFADWFEIDRWTWLAAAGGWLAVIGLGAAAFRLRSRGAVLAAGLAGAVVCGLSLWAVARLDGGAKNPARAIVLADDTRALYAPADNMKAVSILAAGSEVLVLSEQGVWDYVQLGDGSRGWVSAGQVGKVVPPAARG